MIYVTGPAFHVYYLFVIGCNSSASVSYTGIPYFLTFLRYCAFFQIVRVYNQNTHSSFGTDVVLSRLVGAFLG